MTFYFITMLLGIILTFILANLDKYHATRIDADNLKLEEEDAWIKKLEGRKKIYFILLIICFIPLIQALVPIVALLSIIALTAHSSLPNKLF